MASSCAINKGARKIGTGTATGGSDNGAGTLTLRDACPFVGA